MLLFLLACQTPAVVVPAEDGADTGALAPAQIEAVPLTGRALVRRLSIDLRGTVPTWDELSDIDDDATIHDDAVSDLVETFLDQLCSLHHKPRKQFAPDAMQFILAYRWPGNVRELKNVIERIVVTCPDREVAQEGLPSRVREVGPEPDSFPVPLGTSIQDVERELITKTLAHLTSNRREAAAVLGISVRTLQYKIKEYNLFSS